MSESASISIDSDDAPVNSKVDAKSEEKQIDAIVSDSDDDVPPSKKRVKESESSSLDESDVSVSVSDSDGDSGSGKAKPRDFDVSRISANDDEIVVMKPKEKAEAYKADDRFSDTDDEPTVGKARHRSQPIARVAPPVEANTRSKACLLL